ncbi:hypothetical protein LW135_00645 [Helicobacter sp. faydin-H20]|uniref:hypothetical protein n=1 Tax=Helicobacter anatolicus TaxID=2905874 RepID=UPI001E4BD4F4|nr:hypothetical protein [Helicobacter anatolicus]MCE3036341.1 hypothetical protein [Helicobacter anatolicus]
MLDSFVYKMYEDDDFDEETEYSDDFDEEDEEVSRYYNGYDDDDYQNPDNDYEED